MMKKRSALPAASAVLLVFLLFSCMRQPYVPPSERQAEDFDKEYYIINTLAETISIINGNDTDEVYPDILTTGMWPNYIHFHRGNLYIVNSGDNAISVYDESTFEYIGEIYFGAGSNPWTIIPKDGTDTAFVPCFASGDMAVVNLADLSIEKRVPLGKGPEAGVYQDGKVYVGNTAWNYQHFTFDDGTVSVIDADSGEKTATVTVGINPQSILAFPDDIHEIHVICTGKNGGPGSDDGEVVVIDTLTDEVTETIALGGSPIGGSGSIDWDNDMVYLSGVGGILSYNFRTKTAVNGSDNYLLAGTDRESDLFGGLVVDEEKSRLLICYFTGDSILEIDLNDYSIVKEIEGSDGPQSIYLFTE